MSDNIIQGSPEWFAIRLGKVTASRIADVVARTKTGWGASRANYAAALVAERLTGKQMPAYVSAEMQWGIDQEPTARAAYELYRDVDVTEVGFIQHPTIEQAGASPDGLVGDDGHVEIKCPNPATHIETLRYGDIDGRYVKQMQWQMACSGRKWCDFVSFDPRMPVAMQLFVQRVPRDDVMIAALEKDVLVFLKEIDETVSALRERYTPKRNMMMAG